jgi:hypothetical protein
MNHQGRSPYHAKTVRPVESALREYERLRIPRAGVIVRDSWQAGRILQLDQPAPELVRDWFIGSSPDRHLGMRMFRNLLIYKVPQLYPSAQQLRVGRVIPPSARSVTSAPAVAWNAVPDTFGAKRTNGWRDHIDYLRVFVRP